MSAARRFFDSGVLLYLLSSDRSRADRAEAEVAAGGVVSVQVLNEFAEIALAHLELALEDVRAVLATVRERCEVVPITAETHDLALELVGAGDLSIRDATLVASALLAGCTRLLTEELEHGRRFEKRLVVRDPFR